MSSRLGLGRIIEWAKNADMEELSYVFYRLDTIQRERFKEAGGQRRTRKPRVAKSANAQEQAAAAS